MATGGRQLRAEYSHGPKCVNWTSHRLVMGAQFLTNIVKVVPHIGKCRRTNAVEEREIKKLGLNPRRKNANRVRNVTLIICRTGTLARSLSNGPNDAQECPSYVSQLAIGYAVKRVREVPSHRQLINGRAVRQDRHRATAIVWERAVVVDPQVAIDRGPQIVRR